MIQERKKSWHQQVKELTEQNRKLIDLVQSWQLHFTMMRNLYFQANKINKKNLEYFKERCRLLEDNYIPLEDLEDK